MYRQYPSLRPTRHTPACHLLLNHRDAFLSSYSLSEVKRKVCFVLELEAIGQPVLTSIYLENSFCGVETFQDASVS
jgi:hypothetical protein